LIGQDRRSLPSSRTEIDALIAYIESLG